jgi:dephospho-CoA kinase
MVVVLVAGMSGTGKSTVLLELARRGYRVVDTDYGGWSEDVPVADGSGTERLWRQDKIDALLADHADGALFMAGCVANQVVFYPRFDAIVLLSAPLDVILERVTSRDSNDYGKSDAERAEIRHHLHTVEPRLRAGATSEIDTRQRPSQVADEIESVVQSLRG